MAGVYLLVVEGIYLGVCDNSVGVVRVRVGAKHILFAFPESVAVIFSFIPESGNNRACPHLMV
jgi:hypothetical protein